MKLINLDIFAQPKKRGPSYTGSLLTVVGMALFFYYSYEKIYGLLTSIETNSTFAFSNGTVINRTVYCNATYKNNQGTYLSYDYCVLYSPTCSYYTTPFLIPANQSMTLPFCVDGSSYGVALSQTPGNPCWKYGVQVGVVEFQQSSFGDFTGLYHAPGYMYPSFMVNLTTNVELNQTRYTSVSLNTVGAGGVYIMQPYETFDYSLLMNMTCSDFDGKYFNYPPIYSKWQLGVVYIDTVSEVKLIAKLGDIPGVLSGFWSAELAIGGVILSIYLMLTSKKAQRSKNSSFCRRVFLLIDQLAEDVREEPRNHGVILAVLSVITFLGIAVYMLYLSSQREIVTVISETLPKVNGSQFKGTFKCPHYGGGQINSYCALYSPDCQALNDPVIVGVDQSIETTFCLDESVYFISFLTNSSINCTNVNSPIINLYLANNPFLYDMGIVNNISLIQYAFKNYFASIESSTDLYGNFAQTIKLIPYTVNTAIADNSILAATAVLNKICLPGTSSIDYGYYKFMHFKINPLAISTNRYNQLRFDYLNVIGAIAGYWSIVFFVFKVLYDLVNNWKFGGSKKQKKNESIAKKFDFLEKTEKKDRTIIGATMTILITAVLIFYAYNTIASDLQRQDTSVVFGPVPVSNGDKIQFNISCPIGNGTIEVYSSQNYSNCIIYSPTCRFLTTPIFIPANQVVTVDFCLDQSYYGVGVGLPIGTNCTQIGSLQLSYPINQPPVSTSFSIGAIENLQQGPYNAVEAYQVVTTVTSLLSGDPIINYSLIRSGFGGIDVYRSSNFGRVLAPMICITNTTTTSMMNQLQFFQFSNLTVTNYVQNHFKQNWTQYPGVFGGFWSLATSVCCTILSVIHFFRKGKGQERKAYGSNDLLNASKSKQLP